MLHLGQMEKFSFEFCTGNAINPSLGNASSIADEVFHGVTGNPINPFQGNAPSIPEGEVFHRGTGNTLSMTEGEVSRELQSRKMNSYAQITLVVEQIFS